MGEYVSVVRKVVARTCLLKNLKIMKAGNNVFMNFQYSRLFLIKPQLCSNYNLAFSC